MPLRPIAGSENLEPGAAPSLVAIGNFDGVHRGHRRVIEAAVEEAEARALAPLVLTFHPHPSVVLGRGARPPLTSIERKVALLTRGHARMRVVVEPFTLELSQRSPEEFARSVLAERLLAREVIVGENFRFGHGRSGDLATLRELGATLGFEARAEPVVGDADGVFSSTRAREAIAAGDLQRAERCLGRPHSIRGQVVRGQQRGRTIGFPTANLADWVELLPPHGVYACLIDREDVPGEGRQLARGVANLGVRPTLAAGFSVEVHALDGFSGDLYGAWLRLHFVARLRGEQRFSGIDELKEQIARDARAATELLAARAPDPDAGGAWA